MIEKSINIRYKKQPVLLDRVLQDMQSALTDKVKWLDYAFGRSFKMIEHRPDGNKFVYPAVYNGGGEYISVLPNDDLGNFSFFEIYDPQKIKSVSQSFPQYSVNGALIIWYDLSSIYADDSVLYTEEIKEEILKVLTTPGFISSYGKLTITEVHERFENIYRGYSIEKVYNNFSYKGEDMQSLDKQFLLYPYAGLRIEFNLTTRELC